MSSRRTRSAGGRGRTQRVASRWGRFRRYAGTILVLALAVLVFVAGLMFDTTAVLRLAFGWTRHVWHRAPLETSLVVLALVAAALFLASRGGAETPKPQERRRKPKSENVAQPASKRRSTERVRQKGASKKPEPVNPDADAADPDAGATAPQRKKATRRKRINADA